MGRMPRGRRNWRSGHRNDTIEVKGEPSRDMKLLSGRDVSALVEEALKRETAALRAAGRPPAMAVVRVGEDPATEIYVRNKMRAAKRVGIGSEDVHLPAGTTQAELEAALRRLSADPAIHGLICQLPLPPQIDASHIPECIDPLKDVDCFHPLNFGLMAMGTPRFLPCTPAGILELLRHYEIPVAGRHVVVLGRSNIVGRPIAVMLGHKGHDATVTLCHSRTENTAPIVREADILIAAMGQPEWVQPDMIKDGAVVIDVGVHRLEDATRKSGFRICGDVAQTGMEARASAITPVPGGVGPMTIAMLLKNTVHAARLQQGCGPGK